MTPRFQRGRTGAISPFFAFQDIITSAMAVLIAIIMLLALYMGGAAGNDSKSPETAAQSARLKSVLDQLTAAEEEIRTARDSASEESTDPALIQGQIQSLRRELTAVRGDAKVREQEAADIREKDGTKGMRIELEIKRAENARAAAELKKAEAEAATSLREMERLEAGAKSKEAALIEEQSQRNQLWVIPDRSASSKEPVLAVISRNQVTLQRFDNPDQQSLGRFQITSGFEDVLKKYSALNQYIVFYFKPSGAEYFKELTKQARDAGFEIGYDAIDEDVAVNFKTPQ